MRRQLLLLSLLVILPIFHASAQASIGVIVYAEGGYVTILRDDDQIRLDAGLGEALGEPVYAGDQITTGAHSFAEIQLLTSRNIVKIAENTTFAVAELKDGQSSLSVTYGRLRARVEQLAGTSSFEVRGISASAGVRGTDFAYDQVLDPASGELFNRISCFEGSVIVASTGRRELSTTIGAGEAVLAPAGAAPDQAVFAPVSEAVRTFWAERPFVRAPAAPQEILDEFPGILGRAEDRLGVAPQVGVPAAEEPTLAPGQDVDPEQDASDAESDREAEPADRPADGPADGPEAPQVTEQPQASQQEPVGGADEAGPERAERRERVARALRTTGFVLTGAGLVTDLAAIGLFYFAEDIFPGWTAANSEYLRPVAIAGVGMLAGGLVSIIVSLAVSP